MHISVLCSTHCDCSQREREAARTAPWMSTMEEESKEASKFPVCLSWYTAVINFPGAWPLPRLGDLCLSIPLAAGEKMGEDSRQQESRQCKVFQAKEWKLGSNITVWTQVLRFPSCMCQLLYKEGNSVPDIQILVKLLSTITTQLNGYNICYCMKTFPIKSAELQFYTLYAQTQIWPGFDAYTTTGYVKLWRPWSPEHLYNTFVFSCSGRKLRKISS